MYTRREWTHAGGASHQTVVWQQSEWTPLISQVLHFPVNGIQSLRVPFLRNYQGLPRVESSVYELLKVAVNWQDGSRFDLKSDTEVFSLCASSSRVTRASQVRRGALQQLCINAGNESGRKLEK